MIVDLDGCGRIEIDSAGTHAYHVGEPADRRMRAAGERRGYQFVTRARKINSSDLQLFDLIIAMDNDNLRLIHQLGGNQETKNFRAAVRLLSSFLDTSWPAEVPDPYYGGDEGFEKVLDMIEAACPEVIQHLIERSA